MKYCKNDLRKLCATRRKSIDTVLCSELIVKNILNWDVYLKSHNVMLFYPINTEISLLSLLDDESKNFYFPVISSENIYPCCYNSQAGFKKGVYNIPEPVGTFIDDFSVIDLIFVPALAVDKKGFRLGYGKGYYDRFLCNINNSCSTAVPIHSSFIFDSVPQENHDKACNFIVNENAVVSPV